MTPQPAQNPLSRLAWRALGRALDPTIALSFDQTGFSVHARAFVPGDLDVDLAGRVCLVTGANSGLGLATARALAERGATVRMLCRSRERGEEARDALRSETGNVDVHLDLVDLSDFESIRAWADSEAAGDPPIGERVDVLVHNAGLLPPERRESPQGHEVTWATHVFGPHLLTRLLRPRLVAAEQARVIWVSSGGMYARRLTLDDRSWTRRDYDGVVAYAETKRAQVVLSEMWARALGDTSVTVNAMHPGWADTPGVEDSLPRFYRLLGKRLRTPAEGADTIVWLAVCDRVGDETGGFWFDRRRRRTHYLPWTFESAADRRALWDLCDDVTGP